MLTTKRKPATVGEILTEEFMQPLGLTQGALAEAMGVQRKHVNQLCNGRRNVTAATALILAPVFGNTPEFWLNIQRRTDLWEAMNSPSKRKRIERAKRSEKRLGPSALTAALASSALAQDVAAGAIPALSGQRVHDHRSCDRRCRPGEQRRELALDPAERAPV